MTKEFEAPPEKVVSEESFIDAAKKISTSLSRLSENKGKVDFMLSLANKEKGIIKFQLIGAESTLDNALTAAYELSDDPDKWGGIALDGWIINVSGFSKPKMNTAVAIGIAFGVKLISYQEAENLAHNPKINCVSEYMEHEGAITDPFLKHEVGSDYPLWPDSDI